MMKITFSLVFFFAFALMMIITVNVDALKVGFYDSTCPQAETIIRQIVQTRFRNDKSVTAALLRMHFHDCFVRGCDASILIDSTNANQSEKTAGPNLTVREFNLIDEIKYQLETVCPTTVSCADIITLATRDAVSLARGPTYTIPTGRRDGLISNVNDVDLPAPSFTVSQATQAFQRRGLTLNDMIILLGGHSVGVSHCSFFQDRLYGGDPTMNQSLVSKLTRTCGATHQGDNPTAFLDQSTSFRVDNGYYNQLMSNKGVLKIDQELALDKASSGLVSRLAANEGMFRKSFANAMVKMSKVQVLEGSDGEIRTNCRVFNY